MEIIDVLWMFGMHVVSSCVGIKLAIWLDELQSKKRRKENAK